jgi:hypothetical protein
MFGAVVYARCNWNRRQNWDSKKAGVGIGVTFGGGEGPVRRMSRRRRRF